MKHYTDFQITGDTFAERIGRPEEFDAALGRIVLGFSYLEDSLRNVICLLVGDDIQIGMIVSAELGFRQKLDVMGSLVWRRVSEHAPSEQAELEEQFREILTLCRRSEELRNQNLHSRFSRTARSRTTAKANRGLSTSVEATNPGILLDVADFITSTAVIVEEFPLVLGLADLVGGSAEYVEYSRNGQTVARFKFGA